MGEHCLDHTGCIARITTLEKENAKQWEEISEVDKKTDSISSKINVLLVAVIATGVGLYVNLALELLKK